MPLTHIRTFQVRYYECDSYGHLNHTSYLRYMQEAAFDASAAAGYDLARYAAMGRHWLIRETDVELLRPLHYGEAVQVKTWVADFQRVRSLRLYEFRLAGSNELVARAQTDWAFLESATGRPAPIPPEMIAAFFPDGPPQTASPRSRFVAPPPPPSGAFRLRRQVEWRDIDAARHVNNAVYVAYLEDCGLRAAAAHGWPLARMQAQGFAILARRHQIEYRQPALFDDELELATWLSRAEPDGAVRHYAVTRAGDGALLARAHTVWGCVDLKTGQPTPIPAPLLADLARNTSDTHWVGSTR
jgi:acyl-CoA thioester hydrolase